jgi:hypothetical protein
LHLSFHVNSSVSGVHVHPSASLASDGADRRYTPPTSVRVNLCGADVHALWVGQCQVMRMHGVASGAACMSWMQHMRLYDETNVCLRCMALAAFRATMQAPRNDFRTCTNPLTTAHSGERHTGDERVSGATMNGAEPPCLRSRVRACVRTCTAQWHLVWWHARVSFTLHAHGGCANS